MSKCVICNSEVTDPEMKARYYELIAQHPDIIPTMVPMCKHCRGLDAWIKKRQAEGKSID